MWKFGVLTLGSSPGINSTYRSRLLAFYGQQAGLMEIYGATEGMFGQQRDERRYWVPNYDLYFFEVETPSGIKLLHEMKPGETGSLVVSTPVLPRYKILDTIRAFEPPHFLCIGRDRKWTRAAYWLRRAIELTCARARAGYARSGRLNEAKPHLPPILNPSPTRWEGLASCRRAPLPSAPAWGKGPGDGG